MVEGGTNNVVSFPRLSNESVFRLNPFGLDDDDLETDWLIQRNYGVSAFILYIHLWVFQYGRLIFSQIYEFTPNVVDMELTMLPHTRASAQIAAKRNPMVGSVANLKMTEEEKTRLILPDYLPFIDKVSSWWLVSSSRTSRSLIVSGRAAFWPSHHTGHYSKVPAKSLRGAASASCFGEFPHFIVILF